LEDVKMGRYEGNGIRNWEFGLQPLRAVGYEPEAIGAYAPEGKRKIKAERIKQSVRKKLKDRSWKGKRIKVQGSRHAG
jgi:hypothetical protein